MKNLLNEPKEQQQQLLDLKLTHDEISILAGKWLRRHNSAIHIPNCTQVAVDLVTITSTGEIPDVIGFNYYCSILIETKVSRADFLRDKKKRFRKNPEKGMGQFRYYVCPEGLIKVNDLPENWGLLYVNSKSKIKVIKHPIKQTSNLECERTVLLSMLRRGG